MHPPAMETNQKIVCTEIGDPEETDIETNPYQSNIGCASCFIK